MLDLVSFVEETRGLKFKHPVRVLFQPEEEFLAWARSELGGGRGNAASSDVDRALGLIDADYQPGEQKADVPATVLGVYLGKSKGIRVRGATVQPNTKVTLVHELTHALQDQHVNLGRLEAEATNSSETNGIRALIEGEATWVENTYYRSLSETDQDAAANADDDLARGAVDRLPAVLQFHQSIPYTAGSDFVAVIYAGGGPEALDKVYDDPPNEAEILDPSAYRSARVDHTDVESWRLFVLLSTVLSPGESLRNATAATTARFGALDDVSGLDCMDLTLAPVDVLRTAVDQLLAAYPDATSTETGQGITIHMCASATQDAPDDTIRAAAIYLDVRNGTLGRLLTDRIPLERAVCIADATAAAYAPGSDNYDDARADAERQCSR